MLSGMNVKPAAVTAADIEAFVEAGHAVTVLKPRKVKRHWLRPKSHRFGGGKSDYAVGGNRKRAIARKCS